jgi:hypothetical protein
LEFSEGLFLCGFSEGNVTIAQAVIGDIAGKDEKVAIFGWINFFACTAFIIGPCWRLAKQIQIITGCFLSRLLFG